MPESQRKTPDREKVIEGLDICINTIRTSCPSGCPYYEQCVKRGIHNVFQPILRDALALLKEQEHVRVEIVDSDGGRTHWYVCGGCKTPINQGDRFCHECGRKMKWE